MLSFSGSCANIETKTYRETKPLSISDIKEIVQNNEVRLIQLFSPITLEEATWLNDEVFSIRDNITLRIAFTDENEICDLNILKKLSNVKRLSITDYSANRTDIKNADSLMTLEQLIWFSFTNEKVKDYSFLEYLNAYIQTIILSISNNSAKFDIEYLLRFTKLEALSISGWKKNIDKLKNFNTIKLLILRGITIDDYSFINQMEALTELSIRYGASKDFSALFGNPKIETLEFWRVSNLDNLEVISRLPNLKFIYLHQLPNVKKFPQLSNALSLHKIMLDDMKGLDDFTPLETVPNLELFYGWSSKTIPSDRFIPVLKNPSLKGFYFGIVNDKEHKKLDEYIREYMHSSNNPPDWMKFALQFDLI